MAITVTDLDAGTNLYQRTCDMHPTMEMPHDGGWQRMPADAAMQRVTV